MFLQTGLDWANQLDLKEEFVLKCKTALLKRPLGVARRGAYAIVTAQREWWQQ
jgi:hypothetical protein